MLHFTKSSVIMQSDIRKPEVKVSKVSNQKGGISMKQKAAVAVWKKLLFCFVAAVILVLLV